MARRTNWDGCGITRAAWRAVKKWATLDPINRAYECPFGCHKWVPCAHACKAIFPLADGCPCGSLRPAHIRAVVKNFIAWGEGKWGKR